jgi:hypothetical protein
VAVVGAPLISRFQEGTVEATPSGVLLKWRRQVTAQVADALSDVQTDDSSPAPSTGAPPTMLGLPERALTRTQLVDINNDGEQELVVQHPSGAHSTQLQAFGWRGAEIDAEFGEVASVYSNYASGSTVGDLDSDGRTEIASIEPDWKAPGASSASGLRRSIAAVGWGQ